MTLVGLVLALVVIGVLYWAIVKVSAALQVPEPIRTVVIVLFVVIACIWLLSAFISGPIRSGHLVLW